MSVEYAQHVIPANNSNPEKIGLLGKKSVLRGIEMLRGLAAVLIVMHHADHLLWQDRYGGSRPFHGLFGEFHVGVDFFFVISGFIIAWVHWGDIGRRSQLRHYAARRFTRIYPAYWALLIPLAILYHLFPANGSPVKHDWSNFVMSFLLLPYPTKYMVLGVAWTLVYEVCFYAIFGALIFMGRKSLWLLPVWGLGILLFSLTGVQEPYSSFFFNAYNLNFLMGIGAALILRRGQIPYAWLLLTVGACVFLGTMLGGGALTLIDYPLVSRLIFGLSAALVVVGIVEVERSGKLAIPYGLQILGAASYSIYLVHPVALSFSLFTCWRFMKTLSAEIISMPLIVGGIAAGIFYHKVIETRVIKLTRRAIKA